MRTNEPPPVEGPPSRLAPHILVVDDEPQIRQLLSAALKREGYRVTVHEDGEAALAEVRKGDFNVLLTDLKMPRMSGLELIRSAKTIRPELGSILITGFASTETAIQALRCGADDYITKPFGLDDLRRVVERVLTTRRLVRQEREAVDFVREEAEDLRERSRRAEQALKHAEHDLSLSRRDLERRVKDLEFMAELSGLLAREDDLTRILETTTKILATRFQALVARVEVALDDGVHRAEHQQSGVPPHMLSAMGPDLLTRARRRPEGVLKDVVLGFGSPLEAMAAPLTLSTGAAGGMTLLRALPPGDDPGDLFLLSLVPKSLGIAVEAEIQRRGAERSALAVATGILDALEGRGALHQGHSIRVARLSGAIAERLGLSARLRGVVETAARLHDVGEIGIPDALVLRRGPLSESERDVVRSHTVVGARILASFGEAAAFVRHHHERPDGTGYPDGLAGDEIPLGAAIVGAAEAYDAMTHSRPYRPSRTRSQALHEIEILRGAQFVPEVADTLLALPTEML